MVLFVPLILPLFSAVLAVDNFDLVRDHDHDYEHDHDHPHEHGHGNRVGLRGLTAETEITKPLICNCTVGASKFCEPDGTCNAHLTAAKLKGGLRNAQIMMETMKEMAGHEQIMERVCAAMSSVQDPTDIQLLDFVLDWEPSCVAAGDRRSCSLAPAASTSATSHSVVPKEDLDAKVGEFFRFLRCDEARHPAPALRHSWLVCRHGHMCNDQLSQDEAQALVAQAGSAMPPLYLFVPAVLGGVLLLAALVTTAVCLARRSGPKRSVMHKQSIQV